MSMSQEEIESLMNGLDIAEDSASEVAAEGVAPEEVPAVEEPPAPAPEPEPVPEPEPEVAPEPEPIPEPEPVVEAPAVTDDAVDELLASIEDASEPTDDDSGESIDDLINNLENEVAQPAPVEDIVDDATVSTDDIDELLASIDNVETSEPAVADETDDIDALLAGIDGIQDDAPAPVVETAPSIDPAALSNAVEEKIQSGVFPLPADQESKVVTQLSAVAEDSEEKATKIFDVLSYILDENAAIDSSLKKLDEFMEAQEKVLQTLNAKFPNVDVFSTNLELLNSLKDEPKVVRDKLNNENNELFAAMELMQYHDINRQKIERVMSVIRKLSVYLNNIFEDDKSHEEIVVAKHIAGDHNDDLVGDEDLDALIAEFGN